MSNANKPAFPLSSEAVRLTGETGALSKREYFAAMAMQGMCSIRVPLDKDTYEMNAEYSVKMADALLAELSKTTTKP